MRLCHHAGTIWKIDVIGPGPGGWECTRCGQQWDREPAAAQRHDRRTSGLELVPAGFAVGGVPLHIFHERRRGAPLS